MKTISKISDEIKYNYLSPKIVGNYFIDYSKCIGHGTDGRVYKCNKDGSNQNIAVKVCKVYKRKRKFFKNYTQIWKNELKNCPYLLKIKDIIEVSKFRTGLVMDYYANGDLENYVKNNGPLNDQEAKFCLWQICKAIEYMHDNGYIHNDIKAENILISDEMDLFYLTDLSFVEKVSLINFDEDRVVRGTPLYMSPEKVIGDSYNYKSDTWSIGVLLFYLLSGRYPFYPKTETVVDLNKLIVDGKTSYVMPDNISFYAKQMIIYCLQKNPNIRYNIKQLLQAEWFYN